jgi:hypothetical protein
MPQLAEDELTSACRSPRGLHPAERELVAAVEAGAMDY